VVKRDFEWDWSGAEDEFQKAIEINPGYVEACHWRGTLFSMLGRHAEALREKTRALAIDPLSVVIKTDLARMLYFSREYGSIAGTISRCAGNGTEFRFRSPLAFSRVPAEGSL
jgi:tetratricopeptide (TPR) repeat protein